MTVFQPLLNNTMTPQLKYRNVTNCETYKIKHVYIIQVGNLLTQYHTVYQFQGKEQSYDVARNQQHPEQHHSS